MSSKKEYFDQIEDYLFNSLGEEARRKFEERLAEDRELQQEVSLQRSLMHLLQDARGLEVRQALEEADQNYFGGKSVSLFRKVLPWAAAIAFIIVGIGLALWDFSPHDPGSLFHDNFEPYPMVWSQRSGDAHMQDLIAAYESGRYEEALGYLEQWTSDSLLSSAGTFYKGMCLLALGEGPQAAGMLKGVIDSNDPLFSTQAQWYFGLAQLQTGNIEQARAAFKMIAETPGHYKSEEAVRILRALE